jgi:hypothetical protein
MSVSVDDSYEEFRLSPPQNGGSYNFQVSAPWTIPVSPTCSKHTIRDPSTAVQIGIGPGRWLCGSLPQGLLPAGWEVWVLHQMLQPFSSHVKHCYVSDCSSLLDRVIPFCDNLASD